MPERRLLARDIPAYIDQLEREVQHLTAEAAALREAVVAADEAIEAEVARVAALRAELAGMANRNAAAVTHGYNLGFAEGREYERAVR